MPPRHDSGLPGLPALHEVTRIFGADATGARVLHRRSNAVYLLPRENLVVRLAPDTPLRRSRAGTCIEITRWLATHAEPVALAPAAGPQPVIAVGAIATFWPYRSTATAAPPAEVAALVRRLHALPRPPFQVPAYQPLQRLFDALEVDQQRPHRAVDDKDRTWLRDRARTVADTFATTLFPLGHGLVHADAHSENLVRDPTGNWLLIDWDGACVAPRELDLLTGIPNHFHEPETTRNEFLATYGYNILKWPGWTLLRDLTELHALGAYLRLAPSKPTAAAELHRRIASLRTGNRAVRWRAIP